VQKRDKQITAALIVGAATIMAAIIGAPWLRDVFAVHPPLVIAGTVVDQSSNLGVGQATVSLSGRSETYVTEDNGNFRIEVHSAPSDGQSIRIHVTKNGYHPFDGSVTPPTENFVIPLSKL
jgi:hypothetical protein